MFSHVKALKNSQPFSMMFILLGGLLGSILIILLVLEPTVPVCDALIWLESLSFVLIFR